MTALVFSAGGMFAAWEVGVWKALRTRVRPDLIVGASAGSWIGWGVAAGASPDDLAREWLKPETGAILRQLRATSALYQFSRKLAEAWRPIMPFALTATEMPRLRPVVFRDREIDWRHLAASASIPIFFPPVRIGEKRYADGGLLGALPIWAAQELGATYAVGLNAWPYHFLRPLLRPFLPPAPSIPFLLIEPSQRLGSFRDSGVWNAKNIERWIALGEEDGERAASSITM